MLNHIFLMGRLTADPEIRKTTSGINVGSFRMAVDRDRKLENGDRETDFIDVTVWRSTADFVEKYFSRGSMIVVSGRLQIRSWTDKEGNKRRSAEVVADQVWFGESKRKEIGSDAVVAAAQPSVYNAPIYPGADDFALLDDYLPLPESFM